MLAKKIDEEETVPVPRVKVFPLIVFPAKLPVDVMLDTVVDASVDDPDTTKFVAFSVPTFEVEALVVVA
jgi:hypothetical protein